MTILTRLRQLCIETQQRPLASLLAGSALLVSCGSSSGSAQYAAAPQASTTQSAVPCVAPAPSTTAAQVAAPPGPPAWQDPRVLESYQQLYDLKDRSKADRALDEGRQPAKLMAFAGITPGMRVAELAAGGGYTAELLARTVGPTGKVYAQNSKFILDRFANTPWTARLKKPIMSNVIRVDQEFETPIPPGVNNLDAALVVLFYHDTYWMGTNRPQMLHSVYNALKPGGSFVVVDHSAAPGTGFSQTETLHRIEESVVTQELLAAGFRLVETADFLRNPADLRDWSASPSKAGAKRGQSDRFVLRFQKPIN